MVSEGTDIEISLNRFEENGGFAVYVWAGSENTSITNNYFRASGRDHIGVSPHTVDTVLAGNEFEDPERPTTPAHPISVSAAAFVIVLAARRRRRQRGRHRTE
jgi:hypothetical protein